MCLAEESRSFMKKKTYYITTPIYYPSDKLHIGHSYTTVDAPFWNSSFKMVLMPGVSSWPNTAAPSA